LLQKVLRKGRLADPTPNIAASIDRDSKSSAAPCQLSICNVTQDIVLYRINFDLQLLIAILLII